MLHEFKFAMLMMSHTESFFLHLLYLLNKLNLNGNLAQFQIKSPVLRLVIPPLNVNVTLLSGVVFQSQVN